MFRLFWYGQSIQTLRESTATLNGRYSDDNGGSYQFAASQLCATVAVMFTTSSSAGTTMTFWLPRRCKGIAICSWQIHPSETLVHGPMWSGMSPLIAPLAFSAFRPANHVVQDVLHRLLPCQNLVIHNRTRVRYRVGERPQTVSWACAHCERSPQSHFKADSTFSTWCSRGTVPHAPTNHCWALLLLMNTYSQSLA
ncbi:hypothetical protein KC325_g180 [Hortaea werneckii]|nr:hypothetical protein KC325_g180 [Hortaea werneckii]